MGWTIPGAAALRYWMDVWRFQLLPAREKSIVFFSEGPAYWVHLQPVIESLVEDHGVTLCYLSSHQDDPGLSTKNPRIKPFCIGEGDLRTSLFKSLKADVVVMSMPDLEQLRIKRSVHPVHYVHVFHSIVSTHMVYRKGAFDYFDSLFLVGPHQRNEIRRMEKLYHLPAKNLVEHGYGRLDSIMHNVGADPSMLPETGPNRILYAPSWGGFGRPEPLQTHGEALTAGLLEAGFHVTVRTHPMSQINSRPLLDAFAARFHRHPLFDYEEDVGEEYSLHQSHLMISDWSGAAFDFAYGLERPVLFMDIPRKINNPDYTELGLTPLEETARSDIGRIMPPGAIDDMVAAAGQMIAEADRYTAAIRQSRARNVFNVGHSGKRGAELILELRRKAAQSAFVV